MIDSRKKRPSFPTRMSFASSVFKPVIWWKGECFTIASLGRLGWALSPILKSPVWSLWRYVNIVSKQQEKLLHWYSRLNSVRWLYTDGLVGQIPITELIGIKQGALFVSGFGGLGAVKCDDKALIYGVYWNTNITLLQNKHMLNTCRLSPIITNVALKLNPQKHLSQTLCYANFISYYMCWPLIRHECTWIFYRK